MKTTPRHAKRSTLLVGAFHAKTHFSQLLERVANGEEITITRHDKAVARLVPAHRPSRAHVTSIFKQMDILRQALPKSKDKTGLKDLIDEGRRF